MPTSSSSSFSSSSSSAIVLDLLHDVIVAMACREYGEGRVFIHTDRIGGLRTGHGDNPKEFWRKILEWTSKKSSNELIRVGLVINTQPSASDKINSMKPVSVDKLKISDLALADLSKYDCIYIVGLLDSVSSAVTQRLESFVENGGGLAIEYPNIGGEDINVLRSIEDIYCYSSERLLTSNAYWTIDGGNHYVFYNDAEISFMSTLRQADFSEDWTILMTNIPYIVTTTTTTSPDEILDFDRNSGSEFGISFIGAMQNGIVTLDPGSESLSSSSSQSSLSSSSIDSTSSSSENVNWDICDNILAEWRMDDNTNTPIVQSQSNDFRLTGEFISGGVQLNTENRHVTGKVNGALHCNAASADYIVTPTSTLLNFGNGTSDSPFSISLWVYPTSSIILARDILRKGYEGTPKTDGWDLYAANTNALHLKMYDGKGITGYRGRWTANNALVANTWNHIIVTYNGVGGTTAYNGVRIYVNVVRKDTIDYNSGAYTAMNNINEPIYMAHSAVGNDFDGYIDQVVVFDKALSMVEMQALYNLGRGTKECKGEYWRTSSSSSSSYSSSSNSSSSSSS